MKLSVAPGLTTNKPELEETTLSFFNMVSVSGAYTEITTESINNATDNSIFNMNFTTNSSVNNSNCVEITDKYFNQKLAFIIVNSIISLVIITGNVATIVAVLKTPVLGKVSNRFLVSLTIADILVGFLASPLEILTDIPYFGNLLNTDKLFCLLQHVCLTIPARASLTSLTIIMLDRGIYIGSDSVYNNWTTGFKTGIVVICIWCIAILTGSVPFFYNQWKPCVQCERTEVLHLVYHNNFESIYLILCWSIMIVSLIFVHSYTIYERSKMTDEEKEKRKLDLTFVNTFGLVFLFSVLCHLPGFTILILTNLNMEIPSYVNDVNSISTQINSSMNFIVYFAHNKKFRSAFVRILCPKKFIELESKLEANLRQKFETNIKSKIQLGNLTSKIKSTMQLNIIDKVNRKDSQEDEEFICSETISIRSGSHSGQKRNNQLNKPTLLSLALALNNESKRNVEMHSQNDTMVIELEKQSLAPEVSNESGSQFMSNIYIEHNDEIVFREQEDVLTDDNPEPTSIDNTVNTPESIWSRIFPWFTTKTVESDKNNTKESGANASPEHQNKSENDSLEQKNDIRNDNESPKSDRKLWMLNL